MIGPAPSWRRAILKAAHARPLTRPFSLRRNPVRGFTIVRGGPIASRFALALLQCSCHRPVLVGNLQQQIARAGISYAARDRTQFFHAIEIVLDFPWFAGQFRTVQPPLCALTTGQFFEPKQSLAETAISWSTVHRFRIGTQFLKPPPTMLRTRTFIRVPRIIYGTLNQAGRLCPTSFD